MTEDTYRSSPQRLGHKRLLLIGMLIMASLACFAVLSIFVGSMKPSEISAAKASYFINVAGLQPGEIMRFEDVVIYRRTQAQIDELQAADPVLPYDWMPLTEVTALPEGVDPVLRSMSPEYFVFRLWAGSGGEAMILEGRGSALLCENFSKFEESVPRTSEREFIVGFHCDDWVFFDVAGRPNIRSIWPLRVPAHRFRGDEIQVGPIVELDG